MSAVALPAAQTRNVALRQNSGGLTAVHTMIDMPEWAKDPGKYYDARKFVRLCKEAHVDVIELKTKNAVGDAMFPFEGRPCHRDWTTETCALATEAGIQFIAYYNVGLDNWYARRKPEWQSRDPKGQPKIGFGAYNWMCIRSPWRDVVLSEVGQVQRKLRPPGMWFDILGMPNAYGLGSYDPGRACFCRYCREAYKAKFGEEMPVASDDWEVRRRVHLFGQEARIGMFRDLTGMLLKLDPGMEMGYNGAGNYDELNGTPGDLRDRVTYNSSEAKQHRLISFTAKLLHSVGKPYQLHTYGGFIRMQPSSVTGTWAAWNLIPSPYLDVTAAITTAHAGRTCIGVNPLPNGKIYDDEFRGIGQTLKNVKDREPWLKGLRSVPGIAIVYDTASDLAVLPVPGMPATPARVESSGLHNALLEAGLHFDVVPSHLLNADEHRVLLLGNAFSPPAALRKKIESFLTNGGLLIATHETSLRDARGKRLPNFAWSDLLGVKFLGVSPFTEANYGWIRDELRGSAPAYPVLFTTPVLEVETTTAVPLADLLYPEAHRTPEVFTDGETPYTHFGNPTGKPLITMNRVGKGRVLYIAGPIGSEIASRDDTWLKRIVAFAVKNYGTGLPLEAQVPPGVQPILGRRGAMHVLSLVNHYAGMVISGEPRPHPQVGPITVTIPTSILGAAPRTVKSIDAKGFRWKVDAGVLRLEADTIGHHALCIIEA